MPVHVCPTCNCLSLRIPGRRAPSCCHCSAEPRLLTPDEVQAMAQFLLADVGTAAKERQAALLEAPGAGVGGSNGASKRAAAVNAEALREYGRELRQRSEMLRDRSRALRRDAGSRTSLLPQAESGVDGDKPSRG